MQQSEPLNLTSNTQDSEDVSQPTNSENSTSEISDPVVRTEPVSSVTSEEPSIDSESDQSWKQVSSISCKDKDILKKDDIVRFRTSEDPQWKTGVVLNRAGKYTSRHSWNQYNVQQEESEGASVIDVDNLEVEKRVTTEEDIYTNGQLHIVTSQFNPAFIVEYKDIFPISLSNLQFDATITDVEYITAEVTFKHQQFFLRVKSMKSL